MKIETEFDLHQVVCIKPLSIDGIILAIFVQTKIEYKVKYYHDGTPIEAYFFESELGKVAENKHAPKMFRIKPPESY